MSAQHAAPYGNGTQTNRRGAVDRGPRQRYLAGMPDEPTPSEVEEPPSDANHGGSSNPSLGTSRLIISDVPTYPRERVPTDHAVRRLLAGIVVVTMCMATVILEVALVLRGAEATEIVAGLTPLTALATAVVTFYFTREK